MKMVGNGPLETEKDMGNCIHGVVISGNEAGPTQC